MKHILRLLLLLSVACSSPPTASERLSGTGFDRKLADSLLTLAFDHEALYTLLADIKPMSSICNLSMPLARQDSSGVNDAIAPEQKRAYLQQIERYQKVLEALETDDIGFMISPFKQDHEGKRTLQITAYRRSRLNRMVGEYQSFFGQWGFVSGTHPEILIHTIEYEAKGERFRGYGYLFGYPRHAVDFFVQAALSEERTGEFVKRDFFSIPVFVNRPGHFVYAVPKGYQPTETDSAVYRRAVQVLDHYKSIRPEYLRADSSLRALDLWRQEQRKRFPR